MNEQLLLSNIRGVLIRLEETILFALIERAQFAHNPVVYAPAAGSATAGDSLVGFLLHETEKVHAQMRRYTSPDEHPFYADLPEPILPPLRFEENPLQQNRINENAAVRHAYETGIVPYLCRPGDDGQHGSSAVADVRCLQALSKRIHYGKFVAESKYRGKPKLYRRLADERDRDGILAALTAPRIEKQVLGRVRRKALTYGQEVGGNSENGKIDPERVVDVYARWIIPLTKRIEVAYLLERERDAS